MNSHVATPPGDRTPLHELVVLRRDSPEPLYLQLEQQIAALMAQQLLPAGSTLPPERQLAEALGISRSTVQNGYDALRARKLLGGRGRRGSVVQPGGEAAIVPRMDKLKGFTQEMRELGLAPSTRLIECEVRTDRSIASLFGLQSNARFLRLSRIRYGDDQPMTIESAWYNLTAAPQLEAADPLGSIYQQLADAGLKLTHCEQSIEATMASPQESAVFGFEQPTPCLLIKRRSFVPGGAMVEYVEGLFRGDSYVYRLQLDA